MPEGWNWNKFDKRNIVAIAKQFGNIRIRSFPAIGTIKWFYYHYLRLIQLNPTLNYLQYDKADALITLERDYNYKPYPFKHYESVLTRFYQGYILPEKFGIDKRKIHLSALVLAGQLTRLEALSKLDGIAYPSQEDLDSDKEYFVKKMDWNNSQLEDYIHRPSKRHDEYPSERKFFDFVARIPRLMPYSAQQAFTKLVKSIR